MKQRQVHVGIAVRSGLTYRGIMSAVLIGGSAAAQTPPPATSRMPGLLTVRPRAMATGTQTARAGEYELDSVPLLKRGGDAGLTTTGVYVPQSCVGTRRCPLVVFFRGWPDTKQWLGPMADKYGMIVLSPAQVVQHGHWAEVPNTRGLDAALTQVLQKFAIDPDKIALMGTCETGPDAIFMGGSNLQVFSRVIALSPFYPPTADVDPPNQTTEFFLDAGLLESEGTFKAVRELRRKGHRVTHAFGFRPHGHQVESYDRVGRWLQESWATPNPAARSTPQVIADPLPLLTTDALTKMTAFWTRFMQEPDSIRTIARRAHLRDVIAPVGAERPLLVMMDTPAMAAQYPSVAAALQAAGLTAQQHDAYRVALASAIVTQNVGRMAGPTEAASVLQKNTDFRNAHPDEVEVLGNTGIWSTP